jgi:hypothetical protein
MAITNASRIADFSSGIGTGGAGIQIDNVNQRVIVGGSGNSTTLEVSGIVSATSFSGNLIGNVTGTASTSTIATSAFGLSGSPNITVNNLSSSNILVGSATTISASGFQGSGVGLTALNASNISSGTISSERYSANSNAYGIRTVQSGGSPTGGNDGDIYYIY